MADQVDVGAGRQAFGQNQALLIGLSVSVRCSGRAGRRRSGSRRGAGAFGLPPSIACQTAFSR